MISEISEAQWAVGNAVAFWLSHGKVVLAGLGPEAARLAWLMADGREMKGSDSRPRPASALSSSCFDSPLSPQPWSFRIPPPLSRLPCPLSVKAAEIQVKAVRPGRGQPPLQHHAPCLLVNCSENWICLLALNCLEETLCKGQNWMNRFLCFWLHESSLENHLPSLVSLRKTLNIPYFNTLIGKYLQLFGWF